MAIYSLNLGFISRSEGRSSVAFSAYISGSQHKDEKSGKSYNYANREDVAVSRILAPEGAPAWVLTPATLWNQVEQFEDEIIKGRFQGNSKNSEKKRKSLAYRDHLLNTAQTAQTIMGAIPLELSREQAEICVEEFIKTRFVSRGLVVHYAIHWDAGNPHFHGIITRRALVEGTFSSRKDEDIVSPFEHKLTRKHWEVAANKHLALAGYEVRIDCRSNKDRGSLFEASQHEGYYAQRLADRGEYSRILARNEEIRQHNITLLCDRPESLIYEISQKRTVFTRKHVEEEIIRRVGGDEKLFAILKARVEVLENPSDYAPNENFASDLQDVASKLADKLLKDFELTQPVGENINRDPIFTSTTYKNQEEKILSLADTLHRESSKNIAPELITDALTKNIHKLGFSFSEEQEAAIHYLCIGPDLRILNGRAGTGKTTLLKVVAEAYQAAGFNVIGTSFQGKAVEIMEREIGIPCKTLDSLKFAWERHDYQSKLVKNGKLWGQPYLYAFQKMKKLESQRFTSKDVILVDEANMIRGKLWEPFLSEVVNKGAKVLIIQDTAQIKSREPGDYGRLFAERFGACETREVLRQKTPWQRECSALLNEGRALDGLMPYHQKGHLHWHDTAHDTHEALVSAYLKDLKENLNQSRIALAYRNRDVDVLNQLIHLRLKEQGALGTSFMIAGKEFSCGDRVRFTQNDHTGHYVKNTHASLFQAIRERFNPTQSQGVKNGTFGTILSGDHRHLKVQLDDGRCVKFNTTEYYHVTHGYALGIHKSEGSTFDRTFIAFDPLLDSSTLLVGMTRHRYDAQAFINREEIIDFKALVEKIGRGVSKETLHDYQVPETKKPYLERIQQYCDLMVQSSNLREKIEESLKPNTPFYKHQDYKSYQASLNQKKELASEILSNWDHHLPYTRLAGLRRDVLEVEVGLRQRTLSDLEHRASIQAQGYMDLVRETRELWKIITKTHPPIFAKHHHLYEDYQKLRIERDSLAAVFAENPKLYRPFLRVTQDKEGQFKDYWNSPVEDKDCFMSLSIKQHAAAHLNSQYQKDFEERLSLGDRELYQTVKSYKEASSEAAAFYHLCRDKTKTFFLPQETLEHRFRETCATRDTLALQIVRLPDAHQPFFEKLKVQEGKLLTHATSGEIREKVRAYTSEKDVMTRASQACELQNLIESQKDSKIYILLKQEGLDFQRVRLDSVYAEKVNAGEISHGDSPDYIFNHIQAYQKASQEIGRSWMSDIRSQKPQVWEEALNTRRETAQRLMNYEPALKVFKAMTPKGIENLEAHARNISSIVQQQDFKPFFKVEHVLEASRGRIREIAEDLLGAHNYHLSTKSTLRFGSSGKINVHISGEKEGLWYDFSEGMGGNILQLVQQQKGLSFREAVDYCAWFLSVSAQEVTKKNIPIQHHIQENEQDKAKRLSSVTEIYQKSQPILGTISEIYLRKERGIQCELSQDLRCLPKGTTFTYNEQQKTLIHDCFIAFGRNASGELSSVQLTKLNNDGTRAFNKDGEKLNKIQYGIAKGSFVMLQGNPQSSQVFIEEGVETALSIKETGVRGTIVASLGIHNIKNYEGPEHKVIICADNDGFQARTHEVIRQTQQHLDMQGKSTISIRPYEESQDFNDVLKEKGPEAVQKYICNAALQAAELFKDQNLQNKCEDIMRFSVQLEEKLSKFKQNPLEENLKRELISYAKTLHGDSDLLKGLRIINSGIAKQMDELFKEGHRLKGFER
ncbi:MAG TPA: MobA/MobL family protein [Alphaproteobacteria bacterium]|nr:MobA/MobL family protein [Alphaproteobacteria bacterium]HQS93125.1 MobA/MobL family protein [Alphaproteobacteria bacterium]